MIPCQADTQWTEFKEERWAADLLCLAGYGIYLDVDTRIIFLEFSNIFFQWVLIKGGLLLCLEGTTGSSRNKISQPFSIFKGSLVWPCLVHPEIQNVFKIPCHIESCGTCMKH